MAAATSSISSVLRSGKRNPLPPVNATEMWERYFRRLGSYRGATLNCTRRAGGHHITMTYFLLTLLVAVLCYACRGSLPEMRIELAKLDTCQHCTDTGLCRRSCCGAVDVPGDCQQCGGRWGDR